VRSPVEDARRMVRLPTDMTLQLSTHPDCVGYTFNLTTANCCIFSSTVPSSGTEPVKPHDGME
jgi:hypothetical protein